MTHATPGSQPAARAGALDQPGLPAAAHQGPEHDRVDQTAVLAGIDKTLDSLQTTIHWASLMVVLFAAAELWGNYPLTVVGITVKDTQVFWLAAPFYLFANVKCLDLLVRVSRLVHLLSDPFVVRALSTIAVHPFVANPFGYFGAGAVARFTAAKGFALLVLLWWTAHASLLMACKEFGPWPLLLFIGFSIAGTLSVWAVYDFHTHVLQKLKNFDCEQLHKEWKELRTLRLRLAGVALAIGLLVGMGALVLSHGASAS